MRRIVACERRHKISAIRLPKCSIKLLSQHDMSIGHMYIVPLVTCNSYIEFKLDIFDRISFRYV